VRKPNCSADRIGDCSVRETGSRGFARAEKRGIAEGKKGGGGLAIAKKNCTPLTFAQARRRIHWEKAACRGGQPHYKGKGRCVSIKGRGRTKIALILIKRQPALCHSGGEGGTNHFSENGNFPEDRRETRIRKREGKRRPRYGARLEKSVITANSREALPVLKNVEKIPSGESTIYAEKGKRIV